MNIDLEVQILWDVGRNDPSEPQGTNCEGVAERSGERDLRGDELQPDRQSGPAAHTAAATSVAAIRSRRAGRVDTR